MGIYGAGKAFNLRYAQNTYVPNRGINTRQTRQPIMFGSHCHCAPQSTNVTINNGPTGFWGFMSGLFGGLSGGGMFGGMGMGGFNPLGGMFNLFGGGMSPFGALNAQQTQNPLTGNQDKLANLKTLYPNHNIVSDGNDKYSATDKDGHLIGQGLSYEDMCEALAKAKEEKSNGKVGDTDTDSDTDTDIDTDTDTDTNTDTNNDIGENKKVGGNNNRAGGAGNAGGASGTGIPQGWYRAANDNSKLIQASKGKNASQVTSNLLDTKLSGALTPAQQKELTQVIIKKNPSVFDKNGNPKTNADYSKLDVPTMEWIKTNILKETEGNRSSNSGSDSAKARAMKQTSSVGNNQYYTNSFAQKGYRETDCKGIYYKDGKHYRLEGNKLYEIKQDVKQVLKDGRWYDSKGKLHTESLTQTNNKPASNPNTHPANNGKTHTGSRQPWL